MANDNAHQELLLCDPQTPPPTASVLITKPAERKLPPNWALPVPFSFFDTIFDTMHNGTNEIMDWGQFGLRMQYSSTLEKYNKDSHILFSPTVYQGSRCADNATDCGLLVLDSDGGLLLERMLKLLQQSHLESLAYTSARNQHGERWRLVVPMLQLVRPDKQKKAVRALKDYICDELGVTVGKAEGQWDLDTGKLNPYSLFYLPAIYKSAGMNLFHYNPGDVVSADAWIDLYPQQPVIDPPEPRTYFSRHHDKDEDDTHAKAIAALAVIDPSMGYDDWLAVGMALHAEFGSEGIALWDDWSAGSAKFDRAVSDAKARSFHGGGGINIGTLFMLADDADRSWRDQFKAKLPGADLPGGTLAEMLAEHVHERETPEAETADEDDADCGEEEPEVFEGEAQEPYRGPRRPLDIFRSLVPTPVLTPEMLPPAIADFAFDEAARMGVDAAAIVLPCLVICAAAIDDGIKIQPKVKDTRWKESARLWGAVSGDPGVGKSPALNSALEPAQMIEEMWREEDDVKFAQYAQAMEDYKVHKAEYDRKRRSYLTGNGDEPGEEPKEPDEPYYRRLVVREMTMEGLAERVLNKNERGVLVVYQELAGLIGGFDAYKGNGAKKDRASALELFDGGPRNRDLVRGTIWVPNWSAGMLGGIQTDKLAKMASSLSDDGLLQRFLPVQVYSTGEGIDRKPDMEAVRAYHDLVRYLTTLHPAHFFDPVVLSSEAQTHRHEVQKLVFALKEEQTLSPAFRGHANKLNGIFARLLLTLHLIETPRERIDQLAVVSGATAKRARDLMIEFFIPHSLHLYATFFGEGAGDARWIGGHILAHKLTTINARELQRANRKYKSLPYEAMNTLTEYGWTNPIARPNGERPTKWAIDPQVHEVFAARADYERQHRAEEQAKTFTREQTISETYANH